MSDNHTTQTAAAPSETDRFRDAERHLRSELRDRQCTGWTCLTCGWSEYKIYGLECDQCGFDAEPYMPNPRKVSAA